MDMVAIKIKITNDDLLLEEKVDVIKASLLSIIDHLEATNGNVQRARAKNEDYSVEYVHLIAK